MAGFPAAGAVATVVAGTGSPQQPLLLPLVPQHPCAATAPGMKPPLRWATGVAVGCALVAVVAVLVLDVLIALLLL
jgi:hypothetical protein